MYGMTMRDLDTALYVREEAEKAWSAAYAEWSHVDETHPECIRAMARFAMERANSDLESARKAWDAAVKANPIL